MNDPGGRRPIAQTRTSPRDNASWTQDDGQQRLHRRAAAPAYNRPDVSRLLAGESLQSVRCTTQELNRYKEVAGGPSRVPVSVEAQHAFEQYQARKKEFSDVHQQKKQKQKQADEETWRRRSSEVSSRRRLSPRRGKIKNDQIACHSCHRINSPEWRDGPDGPGTLCNVCGLVYAKREVHRRELERWKENAP